MLSKSLSGVYYDNNCVLNYENSIDVLTLFDDTIIISLNCDNAYFDVF